MRVKHAIQLCGVLWLLIGFTLFRKGLVLGSTLSAPSEAISSTWLFSSLVGVTSSSETAALVLMITGFTIGFFKARTVMAKTAARQVERLSALSYVPLNQLFDTRMLVIIAIMMTIGFSMTALNVPSDWRMLIDVAVGTALIQGASYYFRSSRVVASS